MTMFKKAITAFALCSLMTGAAMARDFLRVGTEPTFAPFEFLNTQTNKYAGFDMDLIRAVAHKAGYDVKIENMGFDALIPSLQTHTIDVIASGLSVTPERAKRVLFTTPYYVSGLSFLVRKQDADKLKNFEDLKGKNLAVQIGTTGAEYARKVPGANVTTFNTTSDAFQNLALGNSDAVVLDRPVLAYFMKTKNNATKIFTLSKENIEAQPLAFAVNKDNKALQEKLNKAYDELKASGEVQKIYDKWFAGE